MTTVLLPPDLTANPMPLQGFAVGIDPELDPLLAPLNPEQRRAVVCTEGPVLVLAGAGSGKTRVITHRIAWLIARQQVPGWQILAMTFTNKAAGEMRERAGHMLRGLSPEAGRAAGDLWLGTFHSIGVRLLRTLAPYCGLQASFSIYDTDDQLKVIARAMKGLNIAESTHKPKAFANFIDRAKNRCLLPEDGTLAAAADGAFDRLALKVYAAYEAEMRLANAVDFNDLILRPTQVLAQRKEVCEGIAKRFRYVLVDEFQDTNHAQFQLLQLLTSVHGNLCVVGDDDQSIYSWRGAEVGNILDFPQTFAACEVVKLERNYRSTGTILKASTAVVAFNRTRHGKVLWTDRGDGDKIVLHAAGTDRDEADWVARHIEHLRATTKLSQFAIFYRTNALSRVLEESMRRFRLPYVLIGGQRFYERAEVKDALSWCRLLVNPDDSAGWVRAVQAPRRGIGNVTVEAVAAWGRTHALSLPGAAAAMLRTRNAGKAHDKLQAFQTLVEGLRKETETMRADKAGARVLEVSGLRAALQAEATPESRDRMENLSQLLAAMAEHGEAAEDPTLRGFLDQVALVSDTDKLSDSKEKVSLMTVHAAKGLEYDVAFVVGLEEGLLPHANSLSEEGRDVEEERRLLYVAMTRARLRLHLSYAHRRRRFDGQEQAAQPSRFLQQLPRELVEIERATVSYETGASGAWARGGGANSGTHNGAWSTQPRQNPYARTVVRPEDEVHASQDYAMHDLADLPVIDRSRGDGGGFKVGGRVHHVTFGLGTVLEIDGYGSDARLTVRFNTAGLKKLVAKYVKAL